MARELLASDIPTGWTYDLLDRLATRGSGHTPSKSNPNYWNGGIKWISLSDSSKLDKGYVFETEKHISLEGLKNSSAVLLPAGTVVLVRDAGVGKSGIMAESMAVSQHFISWTCEGEGKDRLHNWFLYNWLQLNKKEFERQAIGSTIKTIGLPYFRKLKIAAPPIPEQRKIAKILQTWDRAIATTEKLIEASKQQKKALMQQLLTGKRRFGGFEGEWITGTLENFSDHIYGGGTPSRSNSEFWCGDIPWVTVKDLVAEKIKGAQEHITHTGLTNSSASLVASGTPILATRMAVGKVALASCEVAINQDLKAIRGSKQLDSSFLFYFLLSQAEKLQRMGTGSTVKGISVALVKSLEMTIPPDAEQQKKITKTLKNSDLKIEILNSKLSNLKTERAALMQQLLTGNRRVKVDQ